MRARVTSEGEGKCLRAQIDEAAHLRPIGAWGGRGGRQRVLVRRCIGHADSERECSAAEDLHGVRCERKLLLKLRSACHTAADLQLLKYGSLYLHMGLPKVLYNYRY
eukprot:SAG11_NODE_3901_length_2156_cov_7.851312_1_plen_107_part_00